MPGLVPDGGLVVSDLFLLYGAFRHFYRMSRSLNGPWIAPPEEALDGRAYYAAKSVSDGYKRYLFGWNPTKNDDLFGWNPPKAPGKDYNTWDWGGNLIVHEITQRPDGTLGVNVPATVVSAFAEQVPVSFKGIAGEWVITDDMLRCDSPYAFAGCLTQEELPGQCKISATVRFSGSAQGLGFMLRAGESLDFAYYITLEPERSRITFRGPIMQSEDGARPSLTMSSWNVRLSCCRNRNMS